MQSIEDINFIHNSLKIGSHR